MNPHDHVMRKVIDSNMLQEIDLRQYLSASRSHYAVLPDYVAMESYKVPSVDEILKRWEIISQFPQQALVLKGTSTVCGLRGRGRGLQARLIDHKQTAAFGEFCAGLKRAHEGDARYQRALLRFSTAAREELDTVLASVQRVVEGRRDIANTYTQAEARAIRTREELPQSLKMKFVRNVCGLHWLLLRDHPRVRNLPKDFDTACNLYLFRYALCAHIWMLEWVAEGSNEQSNADRVRNDLVDLLVAVYGTYFDGLMTGDHKLAYIHAMARFMLETMRAEQWAAT
jgi:hypothetical protein